jgi:hypothetical protein
MEGKRLASLQPDALGNRLLQPDHGKGLFDGTPHRAGRREELIEGRTRSVLAGVRLDEAEAASRRRR